MNEKGLEKRSIKQTDRYVNGDCADTSITNFFGMTAWEPYKRKKERKEKRLEMNRKKREGKAKKIRKT